MREEIIKIYTFDELSEEAKQKAIENYRDNDEMEWLPDDMQWKLDELLEEVKNLTTHSSKIFYSLTYCQGDGAMFEFDGEYTYRKKTYYIKVRQSGNYYHKYSHTWYFQDLENTKKFLEAFLKEEDTEYTSLYYTANW